MHLVELPQALVEAAVEPLVGAHAVDVVVPELPLEGGTVGPVEGALSALDAELVRALIPGAIIPDLHAVAVLLVLAPLPLVAGAVREAVRTVPVGLVADPLAVVHIPGDVREAAAAVQPVGVPLACVLGAVGPDLGADSVPLLAQPLALVLRAVLVGERLVVDQRVYDVRRRAAAVFTAGGLRDRADDRLPRAERDLPHRLDR
mmetsp:Transcript_59038/g.173305  ORF Transcript_59038/g.173305 Transcript_59038/m.173305 type:complete len:203 (+) Transcript_59038:432-1040(+)